MSDHGIEAVRSLKKAVDQFAATETILAQLIGEVGQLSGLVDKAARDLQYDHPDGRSSKYAEVHELLGNSVQDLGAALHRLGRAHEEAIATMRAGTGEHDLRQPRTKALHKFADDLKALWPGEKFGR